MDKFNESWFLQYREDILEPVLKICDAHHHLWHYVSYKYLSEDLLADIACGHNVISTVYMECMWAYDNSAEEHLRSVGETRFVCGEQEKYQKAKTEIAKCMVGNTDLCGAKAAESLDAHLAANKRFREIGRAHV